MLLNLDVRFRAGLSGDALVAAVDRLEARIREARPEVGEVFIEIEGVRGKTATEGAGAGG